jgi:RHS repeat-associated protein
MRFQVKADPVHPPGDFSTLVANDDGSFTRTLTDGTVQFFDPDGKLLSETDLNGNAVRYEYDAEGRLTKIIDPSNTAPLPAACGDPGVTCFSYAVRTIEVITDAAGRETTFVHDADGNLLVILFPDGSARRYDYDADNRLTAEASARGFVTEQDYGFAGQWTGSSFPDGASISARIAKDLGLADLGIGLGSDTNPQPYARPNETVELEDAKGNPFTMTFNEFSSPTEITDPIMRTTTIERDGNNLVTAVVRDNDGELPDSTVPLTVRTELDYDALGNVTAQREAAGEPQLERQTRFFYEPGSDRVTKIADPTNALADPACGTDGVTCFAYDAGGNLAQTTDALGTTTTQAYADTNCPGLMTSRTTAANRPGEEQITTFLYDPLTCNLDKVIDAEMNETKLVNDGAGNVLFRTEGLNTPEARTISFTYDKMNRVLTETDGEGNTTTKRYDAAGNEIETMDATDVAVTRAYDQRDRLTLEDDPVQGPVSRTYDANGNLETVSAALPGQTVTLVYDAVNRVEKTTDPLLNDRLFTYDVQDKVKTVTDARQAAIPSGVPTTFAHDPLGQQIRRTDPLGQTWSFDYDSLGNLELTIDAKGQRIERLYDELLRLTTVTTKHTDGTTEDTVTFTYDTLGNGLTAADADSNLAFTYDALNRLKTAETLADAGTVQPPVVLTSDYDAVGNRRQLQATEGPAITGTWTHGYDAAGRLTSLVHPGGDPLNPVSLGYDAAGRLERIDFPNGVTSQITYDLLTGRLENIAHTKGQLDLASFGYTTFADGLIETITEAAGTRRFTYDDTQQLRTGGIGGTTESYQYDAEGNRTLSHLSTSHSHDDANRLTEDDGFCYTYDANGNLETKTEKIAGSCLGNPTTIYVWDVQNRLVRIEFPDTNFATYRYDALGRRIEKNVSGTAVTRYVYDGTNIILEHDGVNTILARYSHGDQVDQPLVQERGGQNYFYHTDYLGSVRKVTDVLGSVANSYDYDTFGRFDSRVESVVNPFTFTAREFDAESGLHFYRARNYDPFGGRFITFDPIGFDGGDLNLYRYVNNNPVLSVDPSGLSALAFTGIAACTSISLGLLAASAVYQGSDNPLLDAFLGSDALAFQIRGVTIIAASVVGCLGTPFVLALTVGTTATPIIVGGLFGFLLIGAGSIELSTGLAK